MNGATNFDLPAELVNYLGELDAFITAEIKPLERENDNIRFFDHRREDARTDWDRGGLPNAEWEALLAEAKNRADAAGHYRYPLPKEYGGRDGTNLGMAVIREHLAAKGLGLYNDLQNEHSIVGNDIAVLLMLEYGSEAQKADWLDDLLNRRRSFAFGITEPRHGSDATHMETTAVRDGDDWVINGEKTWNTGIHAASHDLVFARTGGKAGDADGITCFLVPTDAAGFTVENYLWTFNMPTDHAHVTFTDVRVPGSAVFGGEGRGLQVVQHFLALPGFEWVARKQGIALKGEHRKYALRFRPMSRVGVSCQSRDPPSRGLSALATRSGSLWLRQFSVTAGRSRGWPLNADPLLRHEVAS